MGFSSLDWLYLTMAIVLALPLLAVLFLTIKAGSLKTEAVFYLGIVCLLSVALVWFLWNKA